MNIKKYMFYNKNMLYFFFFKYASMFNDENIIYEENRLTIIVYFKLWGFF